MLIPQPTRIHHMQIEHTLAWKSCRVLARLLTTLLFDLKVYGRENVPRRGCIR